MTSNTSDLINQLKALADNPPPELLNDTETRRALCNAAHNLNVSLETSGDTIHRIGMLHLQSAMSRVGIEIGLFDTLVANEDSVWAADDLARTCQTDVLLMERMLRYWASFGMIKEVGENRYKASNVSKAFVQEGLNSGINYMFETISPTWSALPQFLRDTNYANPTDPRNCAWQAGQKTKQTLFEWIREHPTHLGYFLPWMESQRQDTSIFLDNFPLESEIAQGVSGDTILFVDIGGATGHQCAAVIARYPHLPGRVVLQDQAEVLASASKDKGFETMVYDFFTPQPLKGARAYYLRNVLHDWPDEKCETILRNTVSAMDKNSIILVDEMVIPNTGAHWRTTQLDLTMMAALAAQERTLKHWENLFAHVGLKISKVVKYNDDDSVIVGVLTS